MTTSTTRLGTDSTPSTRNRDGSYSSSLPSYHNSSKIYRSPEYESRRYDAIFDKVVDSCKINVHRVEDWLHGYLMDKYQLKKFDVDLVTDLITDYLKSERYPDPKVMQCELADYGVLTTDRARRLMRKLWYELIVLIENEDAFLPSTKYLKTSTSSGSSSRVSSVGASRSCSNRYYCQAAGDQQPCHH